MSENESSPETFARVTSALSWDWEQAVEDFLRRADSLRDRHGLSDSEIRDAIYEATGEPTLMYAWDEFVADS